jgi:urease beta subunit
MKPGEILFDPSAGDVEANVGRETVDLLIHHTGDRPVQVGSHFHFFEVNRKLVFDREAAYGMRLNIPAGTAVRFEPGEDKQVNLTTLAGTRTMFGCNGLVQGPLDDPNVKRAALERVAERGFGDTKE